MNSVTQPPSKNLITLNMTRMNVVITQPMPLTAIFHLQGDTLRRSRHQWRTMPSCDRVNVMNTLML